MYEISVKGLKEAIAKLEKIQVSLRGQQELSRRLGQEVLNWVDDNFRREGALQGKPWKKLAPNTIIKKRSSAILQDTGELRRSFHMTIGNNEVAVGSPDEKSPYHEFGTRPHRIIARQAKMLSFPTVDGRVFTKSVLHPGTPVRKMLPTQEQIRPRLIKVTEKWLKDGGVL